MASPRVVPTWSQVVRSHWVSHNKATMTRKADGWNLGWQVSDLTLAEMHAEFRQIVETGFLTFEFSREESLATAYLLDVNRSGAPIALRVSVLREKFLVYRGLNIPQYAELGYLELSDVKIIDVILTYSQIDGDFHYVVNVDARDSTKVMGF